MKKYYAGILIPLLGIIPINKNIVNQNKNNTLENQQIIDISAGGNHSGTIIDTDSNGYADTLYMWGNNFTGQIGNGTAFNVAESPEKINFDWNGNLINLELGAIHSGLTVDADNDSYADTLYMWGSNYEGELGNGRSGQIVPTPIKITPQGQDDWGGNIVDLSLSATNTGVIVDTDLDGEGDTLYMWGDDSSGQIGNGVSDNSTKVYPTIITPENGNWNGYLVDLNLDGYHSGVTVDTNIDGYGDELYMWGDNSSGQIGNNSFENVYSPTIIGINNNSWNGSIIDFDLGIDNTAVTVDTNSNSLADTLYVWGDNFYGQSGNGTNGSDYDNFPIPTKTEFNFNGSIINLSLGGSHIGVTVDNNYDNDEYADTLYMWGSNEFGQIGNNKGGINQLENTPIMITPENQNNWSGDIVQLSLGYGTTMVSIDQNDDQIADSIWMWGQNDYAQAGQGLLIPNVLTPQEVNII